MNNKYRSDAMLRLRDEQIRNPEGRQQLDRADRAEKLLIELDPRRTYSYDQLYKRITDSYPESCPKARLTGEDAHAPKVVAAAYRAAGHPDRLTVCDQRRSDPAAEAVDWLLR